MNTGPDVVERETAPHASIGQTYVRSTRKQGRYIKLALGIVWIPGNILGKSGGADAIRGEPYVPAREITSK